jgi:type IV pilus assembly protein PilX
MNRQASFHAIQPPAKQRGVALAVVLILLVVITLLALAAMRGTVLEERMSSTTIDRGLSFQAAEAALREGEALAAGKPVVPDDTAPAACSNGICRAPKDDSPGDADNKRWSDEVADADGNSYWMLNSRAATVTVEGVPDAPRFMIERMQTDLPAGGSCTTCLDVSPDAQSSGSETVYRITARSAPADRADVTLQSTYVVP